MNRSILPFERRTVLKTIGAVGAIGSVGGVASANSANSSAPRIELIGHSTLGARDGGNTYGAVREDLGLAAVGSFIFGGNELRIVDIDDPTDPELVSTIGTDPDGLSSDIRNVAIHPSDPLVFTANEGGEDAGWAIVDVDDPEHPELIGPFTVEDAPSGVHNLVALGPEHVITAGHGRGIVVYDISDLETPREVADFQIGDETVHAAHVRGDFAYLAHWNRGLYILDMSKPHRPKEVARFDYTEEQADVQLRNAHHAVPHPEDDICLVGEEVGFGLPGYKHVIEFDLDTGDTELLSSFQFPQHAVQPTIHQGFWWTGHFSDWGVGDHQDILFSGDYRAGVQVFDLSDPTEPVRVDQYHPTEGSGEIRREDPDRSPLVDHIPMTWGAESALAGDSGRIYASDVTTGFYVFEFIGD